MESCGVVFYFLYIVILELIMKNYLKKYHSLSRFCYPFRKYTTMLSFFCLLRSLFHMIFKNTKRSVVASSRTGPGNVQGALSVEFYGLFDYPACIVAS